jgi:hypothetical protein
MMVVIYEGRSNRYAHFVLLPRIWRLRHNFSAYMQPTSPPCRETRSCVSYAGGRLASASGHAAQVELF